MKRQPGRPPLDASGTPSAPVCLKLPASDYDRLEQIAKERRTNIQDVIRKSLKHLLTDQRGGVIQP